MTSIRTLPLAALLAAAGLVAVAGAVSAQGTAPAGGTPAAAAKGAAGSAAATASKAKSGAAKPDGVSGGGSEGGGIAKRIDSLEEQIVDMQVVIGTLESLAKSGVAASAAAPRASGVGGAGLSSGDAARLDGIETQIRALTAQVEQLAEQVRAQGSRRSEAMPPPRAGALPPPAASGGFGATSVAAGDGSDGGDPIGGLIAGGAKTAAVGGGAVSGGALPPIGGGPADGGDPANPKQLYETAYGYLLQQDYGAAETAFDDFLKKYPNDSLSGNAQYWLGESFYVRQQYKQAASAFLKGYQTYGKSAKAPDSLLKLAMSLDKLGQKDAACSSYGELGTRFPTAAPHIKSRAQSERTRLGCG